MRATRLWNKVRSRLGRSGEEALVVEMREHRAMIEERFRAEGLSAAEARHRAAREFGPMVAAIEDCRSEWSFTGLEALWSDTRYACRALRRDKTFAATAVLTLGAGLALSSVAFTLFNAYVLRPFAVTAPESLYAVQWLGKDNFDSIHPWNVYEEIRGRKDVIADAFAFRGVFVGGVARHWAGVLVSSNYFRMLGARIAIGRGIEEGDTNVVVIGHGAWQSFFQGDPGVLGKKLVLRGRTYEVIGVASREFAGLEESPPDFWAPIGLLRVFRAEDRIAVGVVARLGEGVGKARAEAALTSVAARAAPGLRPKLESRATAVGFHPLMLFFFGPVILALGLVLATCCANVANMLLARGLARQREIGIRLSVGAGRGRLVRQLLTEAVVIACLAGVTGLVLAQAVLAGGERLFFATAATEFTKLVRLHSLEPDYRVFLFVLGAAAAAAVGAALLPALQATRPNLVASLRGEFGAGLRSSRLRDSLIVLQVVVCTVLLACGALLYRRAAVFQTHDTGMRQRGVISISDEGRGPEFLEELRTRPDVEEIALAKTAPWLDRLTQTMVVPGGQTNPATVRFNVVSPSYFRVMEIRLTTGRGFTEEEARTSAPVAIVSEATARALWPDQNAVGKTIRGAESRERFMENLPVRGEVLVVGITEDVMHGWVFEGRDRSCIYLPGRPSRQALALVRGDENMALQRLRQWMLDRWPGFEGESVPLSTVLSVQIYPFVAAAWLGWSLGLIAMALAVSGMYGVMSYLVNQRSKEIGIRMALGASPGGVVGLVMRRSARLAAAGVVIGGGFAGIAVRLLVAWSQGINILVWDSVALLIGIALAGTAALLAAIGPSSRAARIDPNIVLRAD